MFTIMNLFCWYVFLLELMDYLKTALIEEKQNGYLLRLSAHLALFYRSASFQIKVYFQNRLSKLKN